MKPKISHSINCFDDVPNETIDILSNEMIVTSSPCNTDDENGIEDGSSNMHELRPIHLPDSHGGDDRNDDDVEMCEISENSSLISVILYDSDEESKNNPNTHEIRPIFTDIQWPDRYGGDDEEDGNIEMDSENDTSSLVSTIDWTDYDGDENTVYNMLELRTNMVTIEDDMDEDDDGGYTNNIGINNLSEIQSERTSICSDNKESIELAEARNSESQAQTIETPPSGRRIVDIKFLFKQIQAKNYHTDCCHFEDMIFQTEFRKGLNSMYEFQCGVCKVKKYIFSCKEVVPVDVTDAAVLGITSIGLGSHHLNEFCSNMEIPCMTNYKYDKTQKKQQRDWWELAKKEAADALQEEIRLAVLDGKVDSSGNALITVVCDGSWPKRSYNKNFTSLSGCAAIIGMRTNKVIYFDVKDKYCHVCKIAESKGVEPREGHDCNTNYTGASSSMETTIVVEGFQYCETFGARFNEFIADGDSSTHKTISDLKIYQNPEVRVEKDECCNHLYRNFRKSFEGLAKQTKKFTLDARKHITKKKGTFIIYIRYENSKRCSHTNIPGNDICLGVQSAAKHWRSSNVTVVEKLINLDKDVLNAPMHYFDIHDGCEAYYCTKATEPAARAVVDMLKSDGIFDEILNLCQSYFSSSVPSLLLNYNNNMAESFNNLIAKYTGGKRINYCLAKSYQSRVARAVLQYNTDGCSGSTYHKSKNSNNVQLEVMEKARKQKCRKNSIAKKSKPKKARFSEPEVDKGVAYGPNRETEDSLPHLYEIAKNRFMETLVEIQTNRDFISASTLGQRLNRKWRDMRKNLLTSYNFSRIVNARSRKSYKNMAEDIVYKDLEFSDSAENRHHNIYVKKALDCFGLKYGANYISECGLIIDIDHCFLATSPFRLFMDNSIIIVKCPLKAYKKTIQEAIDAKLIPLLRNVSGVETINKASAWYVEIQGQLHVTWKSFAYVVVWLESEFTVKKILRDDDFWAEKMEKPLVYFYEQVMLKELINPRKRRNMPLRAYNPRTEAFE